MFLTSLTANTSSQAHPARTRRRTSQQRIDWARVEQLYAFARTRAEERLAHAERHDADRVSKERAALRTLESMYALGRRSEDMASCAITYFRVRAMRDAQHPDFLGEWLGRPLTAAVS